MDNGIPEFEAYENTGWSAWPIEELRRGHLPDRRQKYRLCMEDVHEACEELDRRCQLHYMYGDDPRALYKKCRRVRIQIYRCARELPP